MPPYYILYHPSRSPYRPLLPTNLWTRQTRMNQGGLVEGLKALVALCDVARGLMRYSAKEAEDVFMATCNLTSYQPHTTEGRRHILEVVAFRRIQSSSTHVIELWHWVLDTLCPKTSWGMGTRQRRCSGYCYPNSAQWGQAHLHWTRYRLSLVSDNTRERFSNMSAPSPLPPTR